MVAPLAYTVTITEAPTKIIDAGAGSFTSLALPQAAFRCDGADIKWGGANLTWAEGYPQAAGGERIVDVVPDRDIYAMLESTGTATVNVVRMDGQRGDV